MKILDITKAPTIIITKKENLREIHVSRVLYLMMSKTNLNKKRKKLKTQDMLLQKSHNINVMLGFQLKLVYDSWK